MKLPTNKKAEQILIEPSTYSDIDFSKYKDNEKLFWFQEKRIDSWLIKDTKNIKYKAESLLGLAAMISIGVETLSQFRYGTTSNSDKFFPRFLENYIDPKFKTEVKSPFPEDKGGTTTYSKVFYFGIRNKLMHSFLFRYAVFIEPLNDSLVWETNKNRLLVDARRLLINFEDGVNKYMAEVWQAKRNSVIYKNFFKVFNLSYKKLY